MLERKSKTQYQWEHVVHMICTGTYFASVLAIKESNDRTVGRSRSAHVKECEISPQPLSSGDLQMLVTENFVTQSFGLSQQLRRFQHA